MQLKRYQLFHVCLLILLKGSSRENEDVSTNSDNLKWVEEVEENGDEFSYYELDTT